MASIAITASMLKACRPLRSIGTKQAAIAHVVTLNVEGPKSLSMDERKQKPPLVVDNSKEAKGEIKQDREETSGPKFFDARWKDGTWDLNMFVKNGKMDWDGMIVAEARRRKFLEVHPAVSTNESPVLFKTSVIPWWAWIMHSHLPEAELLNGRAAMVGFFMAYFVDGLTGLDVVGQTGNFICKAGLFLTIIGLVLFRRTEDIQKLKCLANEATFYDKQWQASWQDDEDERSSSSK